MDDEYILFSTGYLTLKRRIRRKKERETRKKRKMWVQEIYKQRNESGIYQNLVLEMALGDRELYFNYMRISPESFKYLLNVVGPITSKEDTRFWKAIPSAERLCLTVHYLAYGGSKQSLSFSFRIAKPTTCSIINETCITSDDWKRITKDFENIWNLPHCIGAIDGKHVSIKSQLNSGSLYYNYKGFFSMILGHFKLIFC